MELLAVVAVGHATAQHWTLRPWLGVKRDGSKPHSVCRQDDYTPLLGLGA